MTSPPSVCGALLYLWDGEYEGECELPKGHGGPHYDGLSRWETDNDGNLIEGSFR